MKTMRMFHWIRFYEVAAQHADGLRQWPATMGLPDLIARCATGLRAAEAVRSGSGPEVAAAEALAAAHDRLTAAHRLAYTLASAFTLDGAEPGAAAIERMKRFLWPEKLMVVRRSFTEKASSAATFRERAAEPVVAEGHRLMQALVPGWPRYVAAIPEAADAFAEALADLDAARQADVWSPHEGRVEARALFKMLMAAVDFAARSGQPDAVLLRSALTRTYRELRAQAREASRRGASAAGVGQGAEVAADEAVVDGRPPLDGLPEPISAPIAERPQSAGPDIGPSAPRPDLPRPAARPTGT